MHYTVQVATLALRLCITPCKWRH